MNFAVYWQHADAISKSLYFVLLLLSLTSWIVFVLRVLATRQTKATAFTALTGAVESLKAKFAGLTVDQRKTVAEQALLQQMARTRVELERGVSVLGTIASIAPFIGLFGTVWGIFHALVAIGSSGQAGLAQVAAPVGEALIMTGFGLVVAIPAVLFYNICTRQNRVLTHDLHDKAHSVLIDSLLPNSAASSASLTKETTTTNRLVEGQV